MFLNRVEFDDYGPFGGENNRFSFSKPITLIIGRNNSGKSSLIDLLCRIYGTGLGRKYLAWPKGLDLVFELDHGIIERSFKKGSYNLFHYNTNDYEYAEQFIGEYFKVAFFEDGSFELSKKNKKVYFNKQTTEAWEKVSGSLAYDFLCIRDTTSIRRLSAERDITPEEHRGNRQDISVNGVGASSYVQNIINQSANDETLIEKKLLDELNIIMASDVKFEAIRVQLVRNDGEEKWEIFLQEEGKKRFPLSSSGSGLKTILLVLLNILMKKNSKEMSIFCFEELENNLHPALQRRLFNYLYNFACSNGSKIILTSHSPVAINSFFGKPQADIYHVVKDNSNTKINLINSSKDNLNVLEDLGIKASDILQTNGIVWVEGPSDRIYIKAWLETMYGDELKEGLDYQFMYYGGRLLSHYTAAETAEKINIMFTNPHSAIVMDSDFRDSQASLNATKKRVRKEFNQRNLYYWITKGKEIENYLSVACITRAFKNAPSKQVGQFELFPDYIGTYCKSFTQNKVDFARKIADNLNKEDLNILDLEEKIVKLHDEIVRWNE